MKNPPFDSLVWGSLTLAPIMCTFFFAKRCTFFLQKGAHNYVCTLLSVASQLAVA